MRQAQIEEMGSIDYLVMEWSGEQPLTGEVMPLLLELVERGLDLAFLGKDEDGSVSAIDIAELVQRDESLAVFPGAASERARRGRNRRLRALFSAGVPTRQPGAAQARAEHTPPALDDAVV